MRLFKLLRQHWQLLATAPGKRGSIILILQSLAFTIKTDAAAIKQLDKLREKRNISDYERAGLVTEQEAEEMIALAKQLRDDVEQWLRAHYPGLVREI